VETIRVGNNFWLPTNAKLKLMLIPNFDMRINIE
jgi:hypothetical protein